MKNNFKFHFDGNLRYQTNAIESVLGIFEGQKEKYSSFTVQNLVRNSANKNFQMSFGRQTPDYGDEIYSGISNSFVSLTEEEISDNLKKVQNSNGISERKPAQNELLCPLDFTIEMETGTGKTYVYIKTILEMNKRYGFKKFIIVVPSIAIKEGVYKSFEMTKEHFSKQYDNYNFFIYDSGNFSNINEFARSKNVQIMIINSQAFNADTDKFNKPQEVLSGNKPLNLVSDTKPIIIIDEPQSVLGSEKKKISAGRKAVGTLNPMMVFRYSATHREKSHEIYKLDAIDAYDEKLVKGIVVNSIVVEDDFNKPYIFFISVDRKSKKAKLRLNVKLKDKFVRTAKTVSLDDSLEVLTGNKIYAGFVIREIGLVAGKEFIDILKVPHKMDLRDNREFSATNEEAVKRFQIRSLIREHLEKEVSLRLVPKDKIGRGRIKVLSLFFIDKVANYISYSGEQREKNGKYAKIFVEEYSKILQGNIKLEENPKKKEILNEIAKFNINDIHDGYFSGDKKSFVDYSVDSDGNYRTTKKDESTFNLIMRDKEKLLDLNNPLRFIFSHSALKEGWDNPNVFQICTLNETKSNIKKRQEIGRGLRLAVDEFGRRIHDNDINRLTVMANESYDEFAENLQKEFIDEGYIFGKIESDSFKYICGTVQDDGIEIGGEKSIDIFNFLLKNEYIEDNGEVTDKLRKDLKEELFELPKELYEHQTEVRKELIKMSRTLEVGDGNKKETVKRNNKILASQEFLELWNKIKYRTRYELKFDIEKLKELAIARIKNELIIPEIKIGSRKATILVENSGIRTTKRTFAGTEVLTIEEFPNILVELQNTTNFSRQDIAEILYRSDKLEEIKNNPQTFLNSATKILNKAMSDYISTEKAIKYVKLGNEQCYVQEKVFKDEVDVFINEFMDRSEKSVYPFSNYDSNVETKLATEFIHDDNIKFFAKLPPEFIISTPLGNYNPDWAVYYVDDTAEEKERKLYFVLESKGKTNIESLPDLEKSKIKYAKLHFDVLNETEPEKEKINYDVISTIDDFISLIK